MDTRAARRRTSTSTVMAEDVVMCTIGIIGGMSPESTTLYYRLLNEAVKAQRGGLHNARSVILSGFLAADEKAAYGRPVGVTIGPDGSVLMADDVGNVIWRVTGA